MTYGEEIREARISFDMTLEALAKKAGTNKGYISGIENGKVRPPSASMTKKLCKALDLREFDMMALGWAEKAPKDIRPEILKMIGKGI